LIICSLSELEAGSASSLRLGVSRLDLFWLFSNRMYHRIVLNLFSPQRYSFSLNLIIVCVLSDLSEIVELFLLFSNLCLMLLRNVGHDGLLLGERGVEIADIEHVLGQDWLDWGLDRLLKDAVLVDIT